MTEYDFSPEAFEAHLRKQQQIARWVDKTNHAPTLRNPFTPATPAVRALKLQAGGYDTEDGGDADDYRRHRRHESKESRDRRRDKDKERERERYHSDSPTRPHTKRHRSASHSQPPNRPEPTRNYTVPPPLPLNTSYPTNNYPQNPYPPRITSPRDSRHSSRSSSTQVPSPTSYFPQQQPPYSAPAAYKQQMPTPIRSQTAPHYYSPDAKYASTPYYQNQPYVYPVGSPVKPVDFDSVPQYPFSAYQIKQPPLLKRLFLGLTGGNKQQQRKVPRRKRSSSF